jgi:nuclear GTP-binding protein
MEEGDGDSNPMAALLASARARAAEYGGQSSGEDDDDDSMDEDTLPVSKSKTDPSSRAFSHLFPNVLSTADIILYVLDARDPPSTRSIPTERQIAAYEGGSRRLILILNKIDLVPPKVLHGWLAFLRRYHPTLPLRASPPAPNAKTFDHKTLTQKATSETLLKALKSYAATQNFKRALTVGVVGFPNVGKSSVINTLVSRLGRKTAPAPVGAEAGVTTALRQVKLDNKLTLLDSPGVVFPEAEGAGAIAGPDSQQEGQARLILLNALPPKAIHDPLPAVQLLLSRLSATPSSLEALLSYYGVPALMSAGGDTVTDFLVQVARKRGRLGKGGVPNLNAAGMTVLGDWRDGRIVGWVDPPVLPIKSSDVTMEGGVGEAKGDEKEIVSTWAKEFRIEGLWGGPEEEEAMKE